MENTNNQFQSNVEPAAHPVNSAVEDIKNLFGEKDVFINKTGDRLYINSLEGRKKLMGIETYGDVPMEVPQAFKDDPNNKWIFYNKDGSEKIVPKWPQNARLNGNRMSSELAFKMLCFSPYYDIQENEWIVYGKGKPAHRFIPQKYETMGARRWRDEKEQKEYLLFGIKAKQTFYGLDVKE
ncbi:MAG: hypothetical protein LBD07_02025 [Spirochaetaceae bacterium]|jgi:hypothetical protein|nr:hypothetical protein [Spirochaetaceae bacterium]